mmetsp:Transcript_39633/g.86519  ORF Transcript_39633/g.86519 Transcript_39633/m.86519 type:complete len:258 (+) Transcript_39633:181-954(+)
MLLDPTLFLHPSPLALHQNGRIDVRVALHPACRWRQPRPDRQVQRKVVSAPSHQQQLKSGEQISDDARNHYSIVADHHSINRPHRIVDHRSADNRERQRRRIFCTQDLANLCQRRRKQQQVYRDHQQSQQAQRHKHAHHKKSCAASSHRHDETERRVSCCALALLVGETVMDSEPQHLARKSKKIVPPHRNFGDPNSVCHGHHIGSNLPKKNCHRNPFCRNLLHCLAHNRNSSHEAKHCSDWADSGKSRFGNFWPKH